MTVRDTSTPDYTMGFNDMYLRSLREYTAVTHAGYLLPHLMPGQRVLDFGCGPGAISVGLAQAVNPGELYGVDMEESQIKMARAEARKQGAENAFFDQGDVCALEFEDCFFDVAHGHDVLMHVPDTEAVLAEVRRVLKPGGIIACRELILQACFTHPDFGIFQKSCEMFADLIAANDGHPHMGKELKGHIHSAGFEDIQLSCSWTTFGTPEEVSAIYEVLNGWFLSEEISEAAIQHGAWARELADQIRLAYREWKDSPGAFLAVAYCELLARKP